METLLLPVPVHTNFAPIHLRLMTWRSFKSYCCFRGNLRSNWPHKVSQDSDSTRVPCCSNLVQDDNCIKASFLHPLTNVSFKRRQFFRFLHCPPIEARDPFL